MTVTYFSASRMDRKNQKTVYYSLNIRHEAISTTSVKKKCKHSYFAVSGTRRKTEKVHIIQQPKELHIAKAVKNGNKIDKTVKKVETLHKDAKTPKCT